MASTQIAVVMMTKAEATIARDKINTHIGSAFAVAKDFYHREGWRALGYKDWKSCAEKEFGHGRTRIHQLLNEVQVEQELGPKAPALSGRALQSLKDVPKGQRKTALKAAQKEHKTPTPTGPQIKKTVKNRWAKSGVVKPKAKKAKGVSEQAKDDPDLQKALAVLGATVSRDFRKTLEDDNGPLDRHEIIKLSEQDDETMLAAAKLITTYHGWSLRQALAILAEMPTEEYKLKDVFFHVVASPSDEWDADFGAFTVTIKVNRKKL